VRADYQNRAARSVITGTHLPEANAVPAILSTILLTVRALLTGGGGRVSVKAMAPGWLTAVAWTYLSICFACAGVIGYDIAGRHRHQPMAVMNAVYPITALYFGPLAVWFYWRWGRAPAKAHASTAPLHADPVAEAALAGPGHPGQLPREHASPAPAGEPQPAARRRPGWVMMATEVSHCGAGCVLGDVVSEFVIFWFALAIAGTTLWAEYTGDYIAALAFGIVFQFFAIAPMRGLGVRDGLRAAAKADVLSLTFFEIGLFGWMAVMTFVLFPAPHQLMPNAAAYWLLMQVGMIIGYFTSWPANVWLIRAGVKVPM
jgi:hypothetical protein